MKLNKFNFVFLFLTLSHTTKKLIAVDLSWLNIPLLTLELKYEADSPLAVGDLDIKIKMNELKLCDTFQNKKDAARLLFLQQEMPKLKNKQKRLNKKLQKNRMSTHKLFQQYG